MIGTKKIYKAEDVNYFVENFKSYATTLFGNYLFEYPSKDKDTESQIALTGNEFHFEVKEGKFWGMGGKSWTPFCETVVEIDELKEIVWVDREMINKQIEEYGNQKIRKELL